MPGLLSRVPMEIRKRFAEDFDLNRAMTNDSEDRGGDYYIPVSFCRQKHEMRTAKCKKCALGILIPSDQDTSPACVQIADEILADRDFFMQVDAIRFSTDRDIEQIRKLRKALLENDYDRFIY